MNRPSFTALLLLAAFLAVAGPWGCGGTETGNPSAPGRVLERNEAEVLVLEVCRKLASCFPDQLEEGLCRSVLVDRQGLGAVFGLQGAFGGSFEEVIEAVREHALLVDEDALQGCLETIDGLDCEDPSVLAVEVDRGLENIEAMIPADPCAQVFSLP